KNNARRDRRKHDQRHTITLQEALGDTRDFAQKRQSAGNLRNSEDVQVSLRMLGSVVAESARHRLRSSQTEVRDEVTPDSVRIKEVDGCSGKVRTISEGAVVVLHIPPV